MVSLQAYQLLIKAAHAFESQRRAFSSIEIANRINEIKYLAKQKKIPKANLHREIMHLEKQLSGLQEIERLLLERKKQESVQITVLKKQIAQLRKKLALTKDAELQKKLTKLSYLLGDFLAKRGTEQDIELSQKLLAGLKEKPVKTRQKIEDFQQKLTVLKAQLAQASALDPARVEQLSAMITNLEDRIRTLLEAAIVKEEGEVKHELLFETFPTIEGLTAEEQKVLEEELPIPSPPRLVKR